MDLKDFNIGMGANIEKPRPTDTLERRVSLAEKNIEALMATVAELAGEGWHWEEYTPEGGNFALFKSKRRE